MSAKYPRTPHLPWSPGATSDDRRLDSVESFVGIPIVITEKLDGSNLCLTRDSIFARSHSGPPTHRSFDAAKAMHQALRYTIPTNMSLFGEWCYAVHSIEYRALPSYFLLFGIRDDEKGTWFSWQDVETYAQLLGLCTVPVLARTTCGDEAALRTEVSAVCQQPSDCLGQREGVVVRLADSFADADFGSSVAKWVREDHVQTDEHWTTQSIRKQQLRSE